MHDKNILIADDHGIIRLGLTTLIKTHFTNCRITECDSISSILNQLKLNKFDYAVIDLQFPDGNFLEYLKEISQTYPHLRVLIFSLYNQDVVAPKVRKLGAIGYLSKIENSDEVNRALAKLFAGDIYFNKKYGQIGRDSMNPLTALSKRELHVFNHLIKGETIKEISNKFKLRPNTITTLKSRIYDKLGVSNLIELKEIADLYYEE